MLSPYVLIVYSAPSAAPAQFALPQFTAKPANLTKNPNMSVE